jgi:serine O-acetyltransferase
MDDSNLYHATRLDDLIVLEYRKARRAFLDGDIARADQIWSSLRRNHAIDLYYEVELPQHIRFVHPLGSVLGRATYGDYLVCYQNCGVGATLDGERPVLGDGVVLFPGVKVLGAARIGSNVFITANTVVEGCHIPDNSIVRGAQITSTTRSVKDCFFKDWP